MSSEVSPPQEVPKSTSKQFFPDLRNFKISYYLNIWKKYEERLFRPTDPSSLAVFRISFGILMVIDVPHERELSTADKKWGNPELCHFPLIHSLSPLPYNWMCLVYLVMWLGSLGITIGYKFRRSCLAFILTYWYIFLLDKTAWNNHSYLFGLIAILLFFTNANVCWSIDSVLKKTSSNTVPFWNYFILRFQIFILYFMAGVKKVNYDWLAGYSMKNLSHHWIFDPFRLCLSDERIDYWIIHMTGFILDSFAGFGLHFDKTRHVTLVLLFIFHFMNSRIFEIGMFPYVGIATMFIFCESDWPKTFTRKLRFYKNPASPTTVCEEKVQSAKISDYQKYITLSTIALHMMVQLFLPFSHFITKGYNGWTNGLYGYSWDMMVHSWDTSMVVVTVIDKNNGHIYYLDPSTMVLNDKWIKHADMVIQFAQCAKRNLQRKNSHLSNISLHLDVWTSLNGRFHQRMYDPRVDLLTVKWSPFDEVPWVMPLLTELSNWRENILKMEAETYASSNISEIIFIADFPGLFLENYVNEELTNVTVTVLEGRIKTVLGNNESKIMNTGDFLNIPNGVFHQIYTISETPSCYMYSYYNKTLTDEVKILTKATLFGQIRKDFGKRVQGIKRSVQLILGAILSLLHKHILMD